MSDVRTLQRSFAGGEIAPEMFGRLDLAKYQTGLAKCTNFVCLPHGPLAKRTGTKYIIETKDSTKKSRLIPFTFSGSVTYILEFGDQYIRFHTNGGTVVEASKTITDVTRASPAVVTSASHGYSTGDWVFIGFVVKLDQFNGKFFKVGTATTNTFELIHLDGTDTDSTNALPYMGGGEAKRVYEISSPYDGSTIDLLDIHYAQANDTLTLTHPSYAQRELTITSAASWALSTITFNPVTTAPTNLSSTAQESTEPEHTVGIAPSYGYTVTALSAEGEESLPAAPMFEINVRLYVAGNYVQLSWTDNGSPYYNLYKVNASSGNDPASFGFIGQASGLSFADDNIDPDYSRTPPSAVDEFTGAGNFPAATCYFEQRRVFAGTNNRPQNTWLTRSGSDSNMSRSFPVRDDDSIEFRIAARELNAIKHAVAINDLLLFTGSAVWVVRSPTDGALTSANISVRPTAYIGASDVQPVTAGNAVLFDESRGGHRIELNYSWEQGGYSTRDLSILAPHLFDGFTTADMTYSIAPYKVQWSVRSDGKLLGLTYLPEQDVIAWHAQETKGGLFESCASVAEGTTDAVYTIVKRTINSRTVRYIERFSMAAFDDAEDAYYVDCGLTYDSPGNPETAVDNLLHLEGETVAILADGAVLPQQTVEDGELTIDNAAETIHVGLPITSQIQTLPFIYEAADFGHGVEKNVNKLNLRVYRSGSIQAGPSFTELREFKQRTDEAYGSPPDLYTGIADIEIDPDWTSDGQVCIQHDDPLPMTLLSMSLEVALGD